MKKLFLTLIVVLAYVSSVFAQDFLGVNPNNYESNWPTFNYHDYFLQEPFVAAITIDGQVVNLDTENWSALEVAAFVTTAEGQEECRSNHMWLTDEYVIEYEDPFLTIDGFPIYYNTIGGTVYFKMYDHANNIEYTECTVTYLGEPYTVTAGIEVVYGWGDGLEPVMLNFTTPTTVECAKIELDDNGQWIEDFDELAAGESPECWTWTSLVSAEIDTVVTDTMPYVYANPAFAHESTNSLRMWHRGIYALPELSEDINLNEMSMGFYVRQPFWFYTLQVGVMDDPEDPSTFVPVAYADNGGSTSVTLFECDFSNYHGEGRYIAFKNIIPDVSYDVHSTNYIDHIVLTYMSAEELACDPINYYSDDFEGYTTLVQRATGVEPKCWEMVHQYVEMTPTTSPQIYYKPEYSISYGDNYGAYTLRMVNRCIYALPEFSADVDMTKLHLEMYVRQPNKCYQLEVGFWEAETETFVPVALVNNSSTTEMEFFFCDLSNYTGTSHRIAFRNSLNSGVNHDYSYNYIDGISIYEFDSQDEDYCENSIPFSEYFDDYTFSMTPATGSSPYCWEVVKEDVESTVAANRPQVYYKPDYAYSGDYSLRMVDRCVYALPYFYNTNINELKLSMYLRQPVNCYQLEVGVWEEEANPVSGAESATGTFVPVATFNNEGTDMAYVECDFSSYTGNGGRIAFRNTLNGGANYTYSYNYIDNVKVNHADNQRNNASNESVIDGMGVDQYLESIAVYPNPTVGELHIGAVDVQKVECYNQMGQLVAVYDNESNISLNSLANGVYTLRITVPQGVTMRKVVKK